MKFAHPNFLYALFLLIIPIIIHFFNFRRHKTIYFSNVKFLKKVEQQTKSISKLKHWLLLFLRMLAITCLVLAFARPYVPLTKDDNSESNTIAFYIDNSESMQNMSQNGILLSNAIQTAKNIVNQSSVKTKYLISTNSFKGENQRLLSKRDALDALDEIKMSNKTTDFKSILDFQIRTLDKTKQLKNTHFVYLSDFQKSTSGLPFESESNLENKFTPIQIKAENKGNLFIDSVWFSTPVRKTGFNNSLNFRIQNKSNNEIEGIGIKLEIGSLKRNVTLNIPANGSTNGQISYTDKTEGAHFGQLSVSDRHVTFDDDFYFSYFISKDLSVYVINGENATDLPYNLFELDSVVNIKKSSENQIEVSQLETSDLVVLNELNNLSSGLRDALEKFSQQGGSVVILPAKDADINSYNSFLSEVRMPLLEKISGSKNLKSINYNNPFFKNIFLKQEQSVDLPKVKQHYPMQITQNTRFLPLLSFSDRTPFFVMSNQKQIYLASAGANREFGDFGYHALFSTILLRISENSKSSNPIYTNPNRKDIYAYRIDGKDAIIKANHLNEEINFIPFQRNYGGQIELFLNQTENISSLPVGNYKLKNEEKNIGTLSLNRNVVESDLENFEANELQSLFEKSGLKNVESFTIDENNQQIKFGSVSKKEYWRWLLIFALACLLMEIVLIKILK